MVNKLISLILFGIWFKLYNVFFYSFFDIPVEFVIGEGINMYKVYWLIFFVVSTAIAIKTLKIVYKLTNKRAEKI